MIDVPTLILDERRCRSNIRAMALKAERLGIKLRPHFKTHQSLEIGRWFREAGIDRITVSSVGMAKYFAEEWDDITIAFPVNIREINQINALARSISLQLLVESLESAEFLDSNLQARVNVFIKINLGNNRAGLMPTDHEKISKLADFIRGSGTMDFKGFLGHAGHTYGCRSSEEIRDVHEKAKAKIIELKENYSVRYPGIQASYGDTPSASVCENFDGIDEIRPGNYVFYDLMQRRIGACSTGQIAVALACPIVAIHAAENEIILYGGGIHLSKDRLSTSEGDSYGEVVICDASGFGPIVKDCYLRSLSQEHGILKATPEFIKNCNVGDLVHIFPVHSCMTANLMKSYKTIDGRTIPMFNPF